MAGEPRRLAEKPRHERRDWRREQALGGVALHEPPALHQRDPVGELHRLLLVVRDEDRRDAEPLMQAAHPAPHILAHERIERAEGLVEQEKPRLDRQRPGQCDALALAARDLLRVALLELRDLHERQKLAHAPRDLRGGRPFAPDAQAEGDVLEDAHVLEQRVVLEHDADAPLARRQRRDVVAADQHGARIRPLEPGEHAEQRGLARAGGAEQREELAARDIERDVVERLHRPEAAADAAKLQAHARPRARWAEARSSRSFAASVTRPSKASRAATAKAPANWYSL